MSDASRPGLLLIGHGTREPEGLAAFRAVVEQVSARLPKVAVEPCFLELEEPTIGEGVARLARRSPERIRALPLLLLAAGHVRRDIPRALAAAAEQSRVSVQQLPHLGSHEGIVTLSAQRYEETLGLYPPVAAEETVLVLVGRGNRDPRASAEMREFAERRYLETPVAQLELAFLAMELPRLAEVLAQTGASGTRRIVVQPHLLFAGRLQEQVQAEVARARKRWPKSEWLLTAPLGPDSQLARSVVELYETETQGIEPGLRWGRKTG